MTRVVPGKCQGKFSIECSFCGYCGGNYSDKEFAQLIADIHADMKCPEHMEKKGS
jgi:hypothetical protein